MTARALSVMKIPVWPPKAIHAASCQGVAGAG